MSEELFDKDKVKRLIDDHNIGSLRIEHIIFENGITFAVDRSYNRKPDQNPPIILFNQNSVIGWYELREKWDSKTNKTIRYLVKNVAPIGKISFISYYTEDLSFDNTFEQSEIPQNYTGELDKSDL